VVPWRAVADIAAGLSCVAAAWWVFAMDGSVPLLSSVDLGFHELGHLLTAWAPPMVQAMAGSLTQLAVPTLLVLYFGFVRRESYATALMLAWLGTSAHGVGAYIADAPYQALPLFASGAHDWAYILGNSGRLGLALPLAQIVWALGLVILAAGTLIAIVPLVAPAMRVRSHSKLQARHEADQAARRATLPRREPRNRTIPPTFGG
jgi:hypothetical protein